MPDDTPRPPTPPNGLPPDRSQGAAVAERKTAKTEPPRMFQVVLLNDDYTPMEFVVMVLQQYFQRDPDTATLIMLKIHHEGRAICGVYTKDVAATKVELVLTAARREATAGARPDPGAAALDTAGPEKRVSSGLETGVPWGNMSHR